MKNNEKGFSPVIVLVILVAVLLGVVGFMVYKNQNKADDSPKSSTNKAQSKETVSKTPPAETAPFVNVIQDDSSITQFTPDKIAKTTDQAAILTALHNTCSGNDKYVTVSHVVFDGGPSFAQEGNYAEINATACTPLAKTLDDLGGSGSANYLHKNSSGTWVLDTSSQMTPSCAKVDGLGYPSSIIATCYDGSTSRAPR